MAGRGVMLFMFQSYSFLVSPIERLEIEHTGLFGVVERPNLRRGDNLVTSCFDDSI